MKEFAYEEDVPKMTQEEKAYYEKYVRECGLKLGDMTIFTNDEGFLHKEDGPAIE